MTDAHDVHAHILLADAGISENGKVHLLGAGWAVTALDPQGNTGGHTVAVFVTVPWDRVGKPVPLVLELVDSDGKPVLLPGSPTEPLRFAQDIIGSPGPVPAAPSQVSFLVNLPNGLPLAPGRYVWQISLDGAYDPSWRASYTVISPPAPARIGGPATPTSF